MSAELYAISIAVEWFLEQTIQRNAVIFTDSLSSIKFLQVSEKNHNVHKHKIHEYLQHLREENQSLYVCWVPAHRGIKGNDEADRKAKEALNKNIITIPNESKPDMKHRIQK